MLVMLIIGIMICFSGILIVLLGILIAKKQWVSAASRHRYVSKNDAKAFTKMVGISTAGLGLSMIFIGVSLICVGAFSSIYMLLFGIATFFVTFVFSLAIYFKAQLKYNREK
jgi:hypothetical protein